MKENDSFENILRSLSSATNSIEETCFGIQNHAEYYLVEENRQKLISEVEDSIKDIFKAIRYLKTI